LSRPFSKKFIDFLDKNKDMCYNEHNKQTVGKT